MVLAEPIRQSVAAQVRKDGKPRVPPGQTPIEYIPDMGGKEGKATTKDWQLHIHGDLGKTVTLTFEDRSIDLGKAYEFEVKRGFAPALESLFHQSVHLRLFLDVMQKIRSDVSRYDTHVQKQLEQLGGVLER